MTSEIFNFLMDKATRRQINHILAEPRFTRGELLRFTEPRVDSANFLNWTRRGLLDLKRQMAVGTADELRKLADEIDANGKRGTKWQRYTGGDILKLMVLNAVAQCGLPFTLAKDIIDIALERTVKVLLKQFDQDIVVAVSVDAAGEYVIRQGNIAEVATGGLRADNGVREWVTILDIDKMIARLLRELMDQNK